MAQKIIIACLTLALCLLLNFTFGKNIYALLPQFNKEKTEAATDGNTAIQVALLLDTSGSMEGLLEQAKSQLWSILNELARTRKNGEEPKLEIALYEYGSAQRGRDANEINQLTPFTSDMDLISQKLFELNTSGSNEYCGLIIKTALEELQWKNQNGLKIIYIAGNEPFTQGRVSYATSCRQAREKGIIVNTIYCGDHQAGINESWKDGASIGGGDYMSIDHNEKTVYIETPYDDQINQLNSRLNDTYIPYGKEGKMKKDNQAYQDSNAATYSKTNAADRAAFKSSKKYKAEEWDLVDAYSKDKSVLKNKEELPQEFNHISIEEMEAKIAAITAERASIQQQIQDLDAKRRAYKEQQSKESANAGLQDSMLKSLRKQAAEQGFEINE